jgi:hypothetical protein
VTGPQEIASVSTPDPLVRGLPEPGVLGPGETVWLRTRADFDPTLNLDLKRPARSRQLWAKSARFVTGAERGS